MKTLLMRLGLFVLVAMLLLASFSCAKPAPAPAPSPAPAPAPKPAPAPAPKPTVADFYKGKTLMATVFGPAGGGYDTWTRLMAPYLEKYTGADKVIVRNMPGAGGAVCWNYMHKVAKPNGLEIAVGSGLSMVMDELLDAPAVKYKFANFNWLGRMTADTTVLLVGKDSPYQSLDDVKKAPLFKFGTTGRTNMYGMFPVALGLALSAENFKVVPGYTGSPQIWLAVMRQELNGCTPSPPSSLHMIKSGDLIPIVVVGHERWRDIPETPTLFELVTDIPAEAKRWVEVIIAANALGRVAITSPKVPKDKVDFLTEAIKETLHDSEFVKKGEKIGKYVFYLSPAEQKAQLKSLTLTSEEKKHLKYLLFEKY